MGLGRWVAVTTACAMALGGVTAGQAGAATHPQAPAAAKAKKHKAKKKKRKKPAKQVVAAAPSPDAVVSLPVTFSVRNINRTNIACSDVDGARYLLKGHLTGKRKALQEGGATTLYAHGLGYGEFFWTYEGVPGYDYAALLAQDYDQVSVTVDRLGYGASGRPDGKQVCLGSQADVMHQAVQALRRGDYAVDGGQPVRFAKVALAGHSAGGIIAEAEAVAFKDVDGVIVASYANTGASPLALTQLGDTQVACSTDPMPGDVAAFGRTDADFAAAHFHDVDPAVAADVLRRRNPDPCGDTASALAGVGANATSAGMITAPVLLVHGADDALFPPPSSQEELGLFGGRADVSAVELPDTGHAVTLGRTAPRFRQTVGDWLRGHGF